jgi:hypothetical protein
MQATYTIILRECPQASRAGIATFLGKAFSLKENTCTAIASSAPIILIGGLAREEAAAMSLALSGIQRLGGILEFSTSDQGDLPKIDWPKRPLVFKREISEHLEDLQTAVPLPDGRRNALINLLIAGLGSQTVTIAEDPEHEAEPEADAVEIKPAARPHASPPPMASPQVQKLDAMPMPEITPFATTGLHARPNAAVPTPARGAAPVPAGGDAGARHGEFFPEDAEQNGFVPNNEDITNILDRLLPEDESSGQDRRSGTPNRNKSATTTPLPGAGFSVFLAKIADEGRRTKAAELIAELAHISKDEADQLSKKVIIPVLKGASKDEAEVAKQKFAKIGILARVKGPE